MKWYQLMRFRSQKILLFGYILTIAIIFTISYLFLSTKISNNIEKDYITFMDDINRQISNNIDITIKDIENLSTVHIFDSILQNIISKNYIQQDSEALEDMRYISNVMFHMKSSNPFIYDITYIAKNNKIYSNTSIVTNRSKMLEKWTRVASQPGVKKVISKPYIRYIGQIPKEVITITKKLYNGNDISKIGYISVDVNFEKFINKFEREFQKYYLNYTMIVQDGKIIYDSGADKLFNDGEVNQFVSNIEKKLENRGFEFNHNKYMFVGKVNEKTNWYIIQYISYNKINKYSIENNKVYYINMLLLLISILIIGFYMFKRMSKSIDKLHHAMSRIENGELITIQEKSDDYDEISLLIKSFNKMSIKLRESIDKVYVSEVRQRKMEIKMLQAQVNPHFLYNTLNLISSIASLENVSPICDISDSLADIFRYNIKGTDLVLLKDELNTIKKYLKIQQYRYPNKIEVFYDVDNETYNYRILKFLIQPLIENAIIHGLEKIKVKGELTIQIKKQGTNKLEIQIKDNGKGISKQKLKYINSKLNEKNSRIFSQYYEHNMGILNVHYRIREFYGYEYGLNIHPNALGGITVNIILPIYEEGREED